MDLASGLIGTAQGCPNDMTLSETSGDQITIRIGGVVKQFSSFCSVEGTPGSAAEQYVQLYKHLNDLMRDVQIKEASKEEFYRNLN